MHWCNRLRRCFSFPRISRTFASSFSVTLVSALIIELSNHGALGQTTKEALAATSATPDSVKEKCYAAIGPLLARDDGRLTPEVRIAYLNWARDTVLEELCQRGQTVNEDCLAEVSANDSLMGEMSDAMFGAVFPPDPSILQNYAQLRVELGAEFTEKYRSLIIAMAVAKRIEGLATNPDLDSVRVVGPDQRGTGDRDPQGNYQPGFWTDESLRSVGSTEEKAYVAGIAGFMRTNHVSALELYQNATLQGQLVAFLQARNVGQSLIARTKQSVDFGEWLKDAMVLLGQRPAARAPRPDTVAWLRYLASINEATPISTPTADGKPMPWPLFPIDKAPWPLLMPLAHRVPLGEAQYIWEQFQGVHGSDRYHTYGPYRDDADAMEYELQPSQWFWDAWPDRILHGGECVNISKGAVDFECCLCKPAVWAGQPGHANLISFKYVDGKWSAEIEQAFAGGPDQTFAQWYFDENPRAALRFRDLYDWAGAEYHLGLALAMNHGLQSYMDTRIAANIFTVLPDGERQTIGVQLLKNALAGNPFNPEIWYRLARETPDAMDGMALAQTATSYARDPLGYWRTIGEYVTRYSILDHPAPQDEADAARVYKFLRGVPGISSDDLESYSGKFLKTRDPVLEAAAVKYDQDLADQGDAFGQMRMGERYRVGDGVKADETTAREILGKAAAQGDEIAALSLEKMNPAIPASIITVTASSVYSPDQDPRHLVDGSGMVGAVHDNNGSAGTMWHSVERPTPEPPADGLAPSPAWVRFDFAQPQTLDEILIWNHNQTNLTDRGFRNTRICGSTDGVTWFPLTSPETIQLPRAHGSAFAEPTTIENVAADRLVKSVIIAAESGDGNYGSDCYGLSAVRFVWEKLNLAIPASGIAVSASSVFSGDQDARHLVNGSGMDGPVHDNDGSARTMWQSVENPRPKHPADGLAPSPAWVRFDFAQPQTLDEILIWNHNQANLTDRGFRNTRIRGTSDGVTWFSLTSLATIQLPRGSGDAGERPATIPNAAAGRPIKSVIIAAESADGNYGSDCFGLSAVRFIVHRDIAARPICAASWLPSRAVSASGGSASISPALTAP